MVFGKFIYIKHSICLMVVYKGSLIMLVFYHWGTFLVELYLLTTSYNFLVCKYKILLCTFKILSFTLAFQTSI